MEDTTASTSAQPTSSPHSAETNVNTTTQTTLQEEPSLSPSEREVSHHDCGMTAVEGEVTADHSTYEQPTSLNATHIVNSELRQRNVVKDNHANINYAATNTTNASTVPTATSTATNTHANTTATGSGNTSAPNNHTEEDMYHSGGGFYECNICFDTAMHPVLTLCGHLFCWSCLAQWLNAQSRNPTCPVCKAGCGKDKVIPIYGRGKEEKDPRNDPSIPTRPAGQRPPPLRDPNRPATSFFGPTFMGNTFNNRGGMSISAGFGFFPLGVTFNIPTGAPNNQPTTQGAFMSRLIMMLLSLLVVAIIFA